jgi:hypothetical protein
MSLPVSTTTITVARGDASGDGYDGQTFRTVYRGVRAVIGSPSGSEVNAGGSSMQMTARLNCDPIDLQHTDRVTDDQTHITYEVTTVARRLGMGIDHTVADLLVITDRAGV